MFETCLCLGPPLSAFRGLFFLAALLNTLLRRSSGLLVSVLYTRHCRMIDVSEEEKNSDQDVFVV